jgi:hypothetical protein
MYSAINDEYPVNEAGGPPTVMVNWGPLKADALPLHRLAELRTQTQELVDTVRFDDTATQVR